MPLKMTLEPQEWLMIGETKVVNIWYDTAKFVIEGAAPVLRKIHTLDEAQADTAEKRVYLAVQRLYLGFTKSMDDYFAAAHDLLTKEPSADMVVAKANAHIAQGSYYGALRVYRSLIA